MIGAKKLTRNTWLQVSMSVSIGAEPRAAVGLRRDRGVVDQRVQLVVLQPLADFRNRARGVGVVGEVDLDVILRARRPTGSLPGKACREQVMTRQPAEEKRITVAWPMPRLAPVRSSVRRGALDEEGMSVSQLSGQRLESWSDVWRHG